MSIRERTNVSAPATSFEVRSRLVEPLKLALVGPGRRGERDPDILKLRELHAAMDRAVLDAYGWSDVPTACEFLLDYEIDEEEWGNKKKPWRYRWPDEVRDEVLARLLELNAERAKEEVRSGAAASAKGRGKGGKKRAAEASGDLFS
jgi:hypothetical protein